MRMTFSQTVLCLFVFLESPASSSTNATSPSVFLWCPKEQEVVSGDDLTFSCELHSSHKDPCRAKGDDWDSCNCGNKQFECKTKPQENVSAENAPQSVIVEVYSVTMAVTCKITIDTKCGKQVANTTQITLTTRGDLKAPSPEPPIPASVIGAVSVAVSVAVAVVAVVIIAAVVIQQIRKHRNANNQNYQAAGTCLKV